MHETAMRGIWTRELFGMAEVHCAMPVYIRSCQKRKGRLRLAEATVAAAQPREIMALVTAVHL
jgi:hypothetical protein